MLLVQQVCLTELMGNLWYNRNTIDFICFTLLAQLRDFREIKPNRSLSFDKNHHSSAEKIRRKLDL